MSHHVKEGTFINRTNTNLFEKVNISFAILFASSGIDEKVETILDPIEAK